MPLRLWAVAATGLMLSACGAQPSATPASCRIPIAASGGEGTTGFVTYPAGTFATAEDANPPIPPGYMPAGMTFDRPFERWLPVPPDWVTSDGRRYAYASRAGGMGPQPQEPGLHAVDVATASDKRVAEGDWMVVGFNVHGIYAMQASSNAAPRGLWLIDPYSGALQRITETGFWTHVTDDLAWGRDAERPEVILPLDHLFRLDLTTGSLDQSWFARDGMALYALGDDGRGNVVVQATGGQSDAVEFWLVGQNTPRNLRIYAGSAAGRSSLVPVGLYVLGDGHGLWIGTHGGLYLYRPGEDLTKASGATGQVAGTCA